jgi:thiamine pyrophosphokinase
VDPDVVVAIAGLPVGLPPAWLPGRPPGSDARLVIAANGGTKTARVLGLHVDLVVGDMDSVGRDALDELVEAGARVDAHARNKDSTDLALALDAAVAHGGRRVLVLGGAGGRADHGLANVLTLASPAYAALELDALLGPARIHVVRGRRTLQAEPGTVCSLLPMHGPAVGVRTEGLAYVLNDEDLAPGTSRGVSNVFVDSTATVSVRSGTLLAVLPG